MHSDNLFMGYRINTQPLNALLKTCSEQIKNPSKNNIVFSCANPHSLALANSQVLFEAALKDADILATDGVGLYIVAKALGKDVGPRITGGDFFVALMQQQDLADLRSKSRVYFFGSSPKVLRLMKINLEHMYPNIDFCGFTSPPYGVWSEAENAAFIEQINAANPDVLWVGMTAPKQELWTHNNRDKLTVPMIGNVGAVFDFCAGTYERAPEWAKKCGLEWLVRLCKEPKRMWRRNFISPIVFVFSAIKFGSVRR